ANRLALEVEQDAFEQNAQTLPTRVDNGGLLEDRQELWRLRDGSAGRLVRLLQRIDQPGRAAGGGAGSISRSASDRQDRALDRVGDGAVRGVGSGREGTGQQARVDRLMSVERAGNATQQ